MRCDRKLRRASASSNVPRTASRRVTEPAGARVLVVRLRPASVPLDSSQ
jgi:hypothetical protein